MGKNFTICVGTLGEIHGTLLTNWTSAPTRSEC